MLGLTIRDVVFVHSLTMPHLIRWHARTHAHNTDEFEFHYFLGGAGSFKNGTTVHSVERGMLFFTPPQRRHAIRPGALQEPISYYAVLFAVDADSDLAAVLRSVEFAAAFPAHVGTRRRVLFEEIKNKFGHLNRYHRQAGVLRLAAFIYDLYAGVTSRNRVLEVSEEYNLHVERLLALFQRDIGKRAKLRDFASELGITPEHVIRVFRDRFDMTPMHYYRRLKMEAASSFLLNTTMAVKEVAWQVGFSNPYQFSSAFKEYSGMSPSLFRDRYYQSNPTGYSMRVLPE